jgi:hypothetical protein
VQEAVDKSKLTALAEDLHDSESLWGGIDQRSRREEMVQNGAFFGRLQGLNQAEREALKGIYYKKYGRTLDADYSFLEGKEQESFRALMHSDSDPVAQKADRLMLAMDKSRDDYSLMSYRTDRKNANKEIRETLSTMTSDEIRDLDRHYKRVYGTSLKDAIHKQTPSATREMCDIYLKGTDCRTSADEVRLTELKDKEKTKVDGNPNPNLRSADMQAIFERNFEELDTDKNGLVSKSEVDKAMVWGDFKGEDAQLIALLKQKGTDLSDLSDDGLVDGLGVSKKDMEKLSEVAAKSDKTDEEQKLVDSVDGRLYQYGSRLTQGDRNLWGINGNNPTESIKPEAVYQGQVGDCWILACVGSLAATPHGKQSIKNMIEDNGDGSYTVTFPGDPKHPVTVTELTQAELAHGAAPTENGIWVAVLEKAYGKYKGQQDDNPTRVRTDSIRGGDPQEAMELLTGNTADLRSLKDDSIEATHEKLTEAVRMGRPMTAGIDDEENRDTKTADALGLPNNHEYSVIGYKDGKVKLRNPHGKNEPKNADGTVQDGADDGTFEMSLEEFHKTYHWVNYGHSPREITGRVNLS